MKGVDYEHWEKAKSKQTVSDKKHPYKSLDFYTDKHCTFSVNCVDSPNLQTYNLKRQVAMGNIFFKVEVTGIENDID